MSTVESPISLGAKWHQGDQVPTLLYVPEDFEDFR